MSQNLKNENVKKSEKYWALLGKFSLLVTVFFSIYQISIALFVKEIDVSASALFKFYEIPDSLYEQIDNFLPKYDSLALISDDRFKKNENIKYATLRFITNLLEKMNEADYNIPDNVSDDITSIYSTLYPEKDTNQKSNFEIIEIDYERLKNNIMKLKSDLHYSTFIMKLKITNNGDKELSDIRIKLNEVKGFFRIKEEEEIKGAAGYVDAVSNFLEVIDIEKIEPEETLQITVWVNRPIKREQIKLTVSGKLIDLEFTEFEVL